MASLATTSGISAWSWQKQFTQPLLDNYWRAGIESACMDPPCKAFLESVYCWADWRPCRVMWMAHAKFHGKHSPKDWQRVVAEFDHHCVRCGCFCWPAPCKDHIVPVSLGGSDALDNLQPLCWECNSTKGGEMVNFAAMVRDFRADVLDRGEQ